MTTDPPTPALAAVADSYPLLAETERNAEIIANINKYGDVVIRLAREAPPGV